MTSLFLEIQETISYLKISATFFEIASLISFLHFKRKQVDIAVIETGLGGRWDATNVITPLISIITSIGYDHTEILGPSLIDIAREKAGIIKKGIPVVLGPDVPYSFMKRTADELGCTLHQSSFQSEDFDQENQETALLAFNTLAPHFSISTKSIEAGLKVKPPCRFERYLRQKEVVMDVAHNAHGFARLLQMLEHTYPDHAYRFLVGFSKGKEISECARLIQSKAHAVHLVSGSHPRLAKIQEFQDQFSNQIIEETMSEGVQNALQTTGPREEVLVIAGSFFIMAEAKKALGLQEPEDPCIW